MSFKIIGAGHQLPDLVVTNDMLSKFLDTNDEWISTRTGILTRHICTTESVEDLATAASKHALEDAKLDATALDLILCTTVQGDYHTPSTASLVQRNIGACCPAVDLNAACSGFLYGLDMAAAYLDSGRAEHVLVVSAEMMSRQTDWTDRSTAVLFGDGAGAVVLKKGDGLLSMKLTSKGDDELLVIGAHRSNSPYYQRETAAPTLKMEGGEVFKFAVRAMTEDVKEVVKQAGFTLADIRMVVAHQANMRILDMAKAKLKLRDDQIATAVERCGNTSSASIPILLSELKESGKISEGDLLVFSAFGGGLTTGACVIKL